MQEHPISFSGDMIRAILEGRKTQTRRVIKPQPCSVTFGKTPMGADFMAWYSDGTCSDLWCPYGKPGLKLWVRETWLQFDDKRHYQDPDLPPDKLLEYYGSPRRNACAYRAETTPDGEEIRKAYGYQWRPSIHMPRWASRITLEIDEIRVERLQDITEDDAEAEGIIPSIVGDDLDYLKYRAGFQTLWDSLNIKCGYEWNINPWVWVIHFHRIESKETV